MSEILIAIVVGVVVYFAVQESNEWSQFKVDHHCKVVGKVSGESFTTITTNGSVAFGTTSGKTGWSCDDGVTYWR